MNYKKSTREKKKREPSPKENTEQKQPETKIKREIEGCNREFKEKTEKILIRPSDLQFFFLFSYFSLIMGMYWMAITILFIVLSQIMN